MSMDWPALIEREVNGVGELPCPVDQMTPREQQIYKMLASHNGFLNFMRSAMLATAQPTPAVME